MAGAWRGNRPARSALLVILCGVLGFLALAIFPLPVGPGTSPAQPWAVVQPTVPETESLRPPSPPATAAIGRAVPAGPIAAPPQRLVYPAAGIDVVVHPLEPTGLDQSSQTIVPPPTVDGYWLATYGVPGAGSVNTTYIAGHSWVDRDAPFNGLSTRAAAGDLLLVVTGTGTVHYKVDSVTTYGKSGLKDSNIWDVAPNRLILISCYTDDFWGTNVVVVASPV